VRTVQVAVPIDNSLRCVALVRGLPATHALMTTNDCATMARLTWCKTTPAKRLEVVSAACLRHLRSLLRMHARHVCTARSVRTACSRQPCVLELPQRAKPQILEPCTVRSYELRTACAYALVATDALMGQIRTPPIRSLATLDALAVLWTQPFATPLFLQ
jgi:hypothetical protein